MKNRFALLSVAGCLALVMPGQLGSPAVRSAHSVDPAHTLEASLAVPAAVQQVMARACKNCHSYSTEWPWYSKITPMNWLIESDVQRARSAVNLSEWATTAGKRKGTAIGMLLAVCEDVKMARMPPPQYLLMHSEARLSAKDVDTMCSWTRDATRQVKAGSTVEQASRIRSGM